jgi:hypothetical protein
MQTVKSRLLYFRRKNRAAYALNFKKGVSLRALEVFLSKREGIQL